MWALSLEKQKVHLKIMIEKLSVKTRVFTLNILQIVFFINKVITCSAIRKFLVYQYLTSKQKCNSDD